jgi:hypothetical protein
MEWLDLKRISALLMEAGANGAQVEEIGQSSQQRPLYSVTIGDKNPDYTITALAGMHASEVVGSLALLELISQLVSEVPHRVRYHFVPVADPDFLAQNTEQLSKPVTLAKLLSLQFVRDLEGNFNSNSYLECQAIRGWLEKLPRIDAFFSLHTAHCVAPGLFFYVAGSSVECIASVAAQITAQRPSQIPLLKYDPTAVSHSPLFPGFFKIPTAAQMNFSDGLNRSQTSIEFVARKFNPYFIGVSEMPLGICTALRNSSLEEIERFNQKIAHTALVDLPYKEIDLQTQIDLLIAFVQAPIRYLLQMPKATSR